MGWIIEESIQFDYIRMVQKHLNLNFVDKLLQHILHLLLRNLLQSDQHATRPVNRRKDLPKRTLPFTLTHLKVINRDFIFGMREWRFGGSGGMDIDVVIASRRLNCEMLFGVKFFNWFNVMMLVVTHCFVHFRSNKIVLYQLRTLVRIGSHLFLLI